jgi:hypothetical protein
MLRLVFYTAAFGLAVAVAAPTYAARHKHKHRIVQVQHTDPAPHRVCDWVGPGGRAVYRCTIVDSYKQSRLDPPPHRVCDWFGPGGRAIYMCRWE